VAITETPDEIIIEIPIEIPTDTPGPALQLVEADSASVLQSGVWTAHDTAEASGGRYVYSSGGLEDVLSLGFYGTQVEVIYVQHPALGTFAVEVDGVVLQTVNSLAGESVFNARANISGLPDTLHTLRVYPVNGVIAVDAFVVEKLADLVMPTATVIPTENVIQTDIPTVVLTETPVPPTETLVPPTDIPTETPVPPTETPLPPTATDIPTETPVPPTATEIPTETPIPPTDTPAEPPTEPETENTGS
jgi:hypothetical protein